MASVYFKVLKILTLIALLPILLNLSGCSKQGFDEKDVVAYVNNEPVFASDLKREIAIKARQDPNFELTPEAENDQLEMMIDRKLIVQEAMEKGLSRESRFVNTIKSFWEQTLIRDFIDYKKKEFQEYIFVTDDEIKKLYDNLSKRVTFKILQSRDRQFINDSYDKFLKNKEVELPGCQTIGPLGYEDITSGVLQDAFEMSVGEARIFEDAPNYYLIVVVNVDKITLEPLENIKPEIEKRLIAIKERRLFEEWLKEKRAKSNIKIK